MPFFVKSLNNHLLMREESIIIRSSVRTHVVNPQEKRKRRPRERAAAADETEGEEDDSRRDLGAPPCLLATHGATLDAHGRRKRTRAGPPPSRSPPP